MFRMLSRQNWFHFLLIGGWIIIGSVLRFTRLSDKPLWSDELATIVFSLGHSFRTVPIDQVISTATLLQPLVATDIGGPSAVVHRLMTESNHPPLYFLLTNLWLHGLATPEVLVESGIARSLSVLFGILGIPALFGLGWLIFRSGWIAHLAAALMAVSPFSLYLSQEARHYTLPILWSIASISCFAIALRRLQKGQTISIGLSLSWIGVNGLGMATHFFFALILGAEFLTIVGIAVKKFWFRRDLHWKSSAWKRIGLIAAGTLCTCLIWVTVWQGNRDNDLTNWVFDPYRSGWSQLNPIRHSLTTLVTFLTLFPIRNPNGSILVGTSIIAVACCLGYIGLIVQGWHHYLHQGKERRTLWSLAGLAACGILILCFMDYGFRMRLTNNPRYAFVYCPVVLLLVAVGLAPFPYPNASPPRFAFLSSWREGAIALLLTTSLVSSLAVTYNFGFQKNHRADLVAQDIKNLSRNSALVSIVHHTHGQTGRLMSIALQQEIQTDGNRTHRPHQFYLDHQACEPQSPECNVPSETFREILMHQIRPFDLWLLEFYDKPDLTKQHCHLDQALGTRRVPGFNYQHYHCLATSDGA